MGQLIWVSDLIYELKIMSYQVYSGTRGLGENN